jgi:preprotein translocase subunit SecA
MHVILSQHHPLARFDQQLFDWSARHGAPGSAVAYIAADDDWVQHHAPWLAATVRQTIRIHSTATDSLHRDVIKAQRVAAIGAAQARIEMARRDQQTIPQSSGRGAATGAAATRRRDDRVLD